MKRILVRGYVLAAMAFLLLPGEAPGQTSGMPPWPPERIKSMGQPPLIKPYLAGEATWNGDTNQGGGVGIFGLYKDLILPVSGGLGLCSTGSKTRGEMTVPRREGATSRPPRTTFGQPT
jgi:hypothetical protein